MNPVTIARSGARPSTYTGENRVPAIVALWLVLVLVAAARSGKLPDQKHVLALGVATLVVAAAAAVAPRIVFYALLAAAAVAALTHTDLIAGYIDQGTQKLQEALS